MASSRFTFSDLQNPLFLHPSDGPTSVTVTKLQGADDYRTWKRSMEIQLLSKRKLGFVNGTELRSTTDAIDSIQWDTCNTMVIAWLHNNISDSIKKSILFVDSASEVWKLLERRFQVVNGSRKYKLNKDLFNLKQNGLALVEYFTTISSVWEELDNMNHLPVITVLNTEINAFLEALNDQKQEAKLFQFLNGLDEIYAPQRSQILMMKRLPNVEMACSLIQQEESQRNSLKLDDASVEIAAMYSRGPNSDRFEKCLECGGKGHTKSNCWTIIGYPKWHSKHKKLNGNNRVNSGKGNSGVNAVKQVNNASIQESEDKNVVLSAKQFEELLKLLAVQRNEPQELDSPFSGMVTVFKGMIGCNSAITDMKEWIIDSGATDHMTATLSLLTNVRKVDNYPNIVLPTGATASISHIGDVWLSQKLKLTGVLYVPQFHHNLISIHKLSEHNNCQVLFSSAKCRILHTSTDELLGTGTLKHGLYYLDVDDTKECNSVQGTKCSTTDYVLWHNRLGHAPQTKIMSIPEIKQQVKKVPTHVCITCPMARFTKLPFDLSTSHADVAFGLVHADVWGPYKVPTRGKYKYFLTLVDDFSRMVWIYLLQLKSEFLQSFKAFYAYAEAQFGKSIKILRTDNALEFQDHYCKLFYAQQGIVHQTSVPYKPQQNGRVERRHRYILEMARALKFQSGLDNTYWGECVLTSVYIMNRLPSSVLANKSSFEILHKDKPDYNDMRAFGCLVFAANPAINAQADKLQPRGIPCVFVGYAPSQKGVRLLNLITKTLFVSRDVTFREDVFPFNRKTDSAEYLKPVPVVLPSDSTVRYKALDFISDYEDSNEMFDHSGDQSAEEHSQNTEEGSASANSSDIQPRRSDRTRQPPVWLQSYSHLAQTKPQSVLTVVDQEVQSQFQCFLTSVTTHEDPTSYKQAVKSQHWVEAMNVELEALERNGTWVIQALPPGKLAIGCRWLYKTKFKPDGTIERYKSRLVILGCKQQHGVDFGETFAPVAKMATVRTLLAVTAIQNWVTLQMDVTNAFLHGDLTEEVYMTFPQGYSGWGSRIELGNQTNSTLTDADGRRLVCKLVKSLYGLRQAPRCWFSKLSTTLIVNGFVQSKADYSLFTKVTETTIVVTLVYVDDLLIAGNSNEAISWLKSMLSENFHMKDLGEVRYFLGLEIHRSVDGFFVSQKKYLMDLLKEYHISGGNTSKLPMETKVKLEADKGEPLQNIQPYQKIMGKLIYLTVTRPDIVYTVHILTQYMQKPTSEHMNAAKRLLRYLANNPGQGVLLASQSAAQLTAYCDSDWASCSFSRRSTSGYCIMLGSSPVSWKTKKQTVVARSSAEAEYRAMALASCEVTWLSALLKDMGIIDLPPTVLKCDNQAALAIAANPVLHERTKHVEIDCHYIRDKVNSGEIVTRHVPSYAQVADVFTKQLSAKQHTYLMTKLGVKTFKSDT